MKKETKVLFEKNIKSVWRFFTKTRKRYLLLIVILLISKLWMCLIYSLAIAIYIVYKAIVSKKSNKDNSNENLKNSNDNIVDSNSISINTKKITNIKDLVIFTTNKITISGVWFNLHCNWIYNNSINVNTIKIIVNGSNFICSLFNENGEIERISIKNKKAYSEEELKKLLNCK